MLLFMSLMVCSTFGRQEWESMDVMGKMARTLVPEKGNGHLKFSGEPRTLLRNLTSYNGQILHEPRFFVKDSESTKVEAIRPL